VDSPCGTTPSSTLSPRDPDGAPQRRRPRPIDKTCGSSGVALQRPYTFVVVVVLILLASPVLILCTPTGIFPNIDIPVIAVAWQFTGLNPEEMEGRITTQFERVLTTTVDNIEHIESTTVDGQSMVKIFLQPNARLDTANAQVTGGVADHPAPTSPQHPAPPDHQLQRVDGPDSPARPVRWIDLK
jgi:multidrug efflux pump subunit AcrB